LNKARKENLSLQEKARELEKKIKVAVLPAPIGRMAGQITVMEK
jgi:hypothetical protein